MKKWNLTLALTFLWLLVSVSVTWAEDSASPEDMEESLVDYTVDPSKPCGTRCQIQRATQAWSGLVHVDPDGLLNKYRHVAKHTSTMATFKQTTLALEQEMKDLLRTTPAGSKALPRLLSLEKKHDALSVKLDIFEKSGLKGTPKGDDILKKFGHRLDMQEVALLKCRRIRNIEVELLSDREELERLSESVNVFVKNDKLPAPAVTLEIKAMQTKSAELKARISEALQQLRGSSDDINVARDITNAVKSNSASYGTLGEFQRDSEKFLVLQKQFDEIHTEVENVLAFQDTQRSHSSTRNEVELEVLRKVDVHTHIEMQKFAGTEVTVVEDAKGVEAIESQLRALRDALNHYKRFMKSEREAVHSQSQISKTQPIVKNVLNEKGSIESIKSDVDSEIDNLLNHKKTNNDATSFSIPAPTFILSKSQSENLSDGIGSFKEEFPPGNALDAAESFSIDGKNPFTQGLVLLQDTDVIPFLTDREAEKAFQQGFGPTPDPSAHEAVSRQHRHQMSRSSLKSAENVLRMSKSKAAILDVANRIVRKNSKANSEVQQLNGEGDRDDAASASDSAPALASTSKHISSHFGGPSVWRSVESEKEREEDRHIQDEQDAGPGDDEGYNPDDPF